MTDGKTIYQMNKPELVRLCEGLLAAANHQPHNRIMLGDFELESTTEPLAVCVQTMNELIKSHKEFVRLRKYVKRHEKYDNYID